MADKKSENNFDEYEGHVEFEISDNFVDGPTSRSYARGVYPLKPEVAERFAAEGRGSYANSKDAPKKESGNAKSSTTIAGEAEARAGQGSGREVKTAPVSDATEGEGTPLSAKFPMRKALIDAGYDTTEKVAAASKEDLMKIEGFNEAKATKVGLAASKK